MQENDNFKNQFEAFASHNYSELRRVVCVFISQIVFGVLRIDCYHC